MDKNWLKKQVTMTTIYTNNYVFPHEYIDSEKRTKKALLITNLQNMKQCTNDLTAQIIKSISTQQIADVKMLTSNK